jgi:hydroxymethylpyrimidine/phosphomethylpyrimidine kinase
MTAGAVRYGENMLPVALTIAGSDPSGGAGIQADLKTFHQFGVYGEAVLTLLTVQNTQRVLRVEVLAADLVREQIEAVVSDIPPSAAKTGALGSIEVIRTVAGFARTFALPLIVDPVMISKHGARLMQPQAENALRDELLPQAFLLTPNIPEAEALTGMSIRNEEEMARAGERLLGLGCRAVLVKGGHKEGEPVDILVESNLVERFPGTRVATRHTHGTGCTYSAAITAGLAHGNGLLTAIKRARQFVQSAIESAPQLGQGCGPLNHFADSRLLCQGDSQ